MKNIEMLIFIFMLFFCGCSDIFDENFNGEIFIIDMPSEVDHLIGEQIVLDALHAGYPLVYDSLIIFKSTKLPGYLISVISLNTKTQIGAFCYKGGGPNDYTDFSISNSVAENNHLKQWFYDVNRQQMILLNITQSINTQTTQIDSIFTFEWRTNYVLPFNCIFALDNLLILAKCQDILSSAINYIIIFFSFVKNLYLCAQKK